MPVNPFTLSLKPVVDVVVYVNPLAAARQAFNQGLILGTTAVIPTVSDSVTTRIRSYTSVAGMLTDGFVNADPEVVAAQLYFDQSPAPTYLWVGRQDLTAIKTAIPHADAKGTGYVVGDHLMVTGGAVLRVDTIGTAGAVETVSVIAGGSGFTVSAEHATTTNSVAGAGAKIDITAIGETPLVALQACRAVNWDWYIAVALEATNDDHEAIALWVESAQPSSQYFYTTSDADVLNGVVDSIADTLKGESYSRTHGMYKADNEYAAAAAMGRAMGLNSGLANSAFTMKFKNLVGLLTEDISVTQVHNIQGANCNMYVNYANYYNWYQEGVQANGFFFDQVLYRDMLANNIQLSVADLLNQTPKVPQTDDGMTLIMRKINQACEQAVIIGHLAPNKWRGSPVLNLNTDDMLPKGYLVQAPPVASQSDADREARKSVPFYVAVTEAGAVHSVLIGVYITP